MDLLRPIVVALASGCVWIGAERHADGLDADGDGVSGLEECDDADPTRADGPQQLYVDADGDGFGVGEPRRGCLGPGFALVGGDCDDRDASVFPGAPERCDPLRRDEDCNGLADDEEPGEVEGRRSWYLDEDGDGWGGAFIGLACHPEPGWVALTGDCDDDDPLVSPSMPERCDGQVDEDCDGEVDEPGAWGERAWFRDADGDGFGDPFDWRHACEPLEGRVADRTDCDDTNALRRPGQGCP